jgi:hypothetical protein
VNLRGYEAGLSKYATHHKYKKKSEKAQYISGVYRH